MSLERRKALVRIANEQELVILEDNPYGLLRYEGEPLPTLYTLDGGRYVIYAGTFSKILSAGLRLGWAAAPAPILERLNLGKQAADLCTSPMTQYFVAAYFAHRDWRKYLNELRGIYRRRRDVMMAAMDEYLPHETTWTKPSGGLFVWAKLPDYIDTTDLLARALREHVAFVPGRAAYLDGRGGSELRLNFSGVGEDDIREGIRRIGKVVAEQVALYGTLTGVKPAPAAGRERRPAAAAGGLVKVAVLKGGASLERTVSLRSGARVEDALARLGHEVLPIDVGADLVDRLQRRASPTSRSSRCTAAAARTGPSRSCSSSSASRTRPRGRAPASAAWTRSWPSTRCATPASRRPTSTPSRRPPSRISGPRERCRRSRSGSSSRSWSSPPARARRSGSSSPAPRRTSRTRSSPPSPTTRR